MCPHAKLDSLCTTTISLCTGCVAVGAGDTGLATATVDRDNAATTANVSVFKDFILRIPLGN
jgi:hypothetical protein